MVPSCDQKTQKLNDKKSNDYFNVSVKVDYPVAFHPGRRSSGGKSKSQDVDWDTRGPAGPTSTDGLVFENYRET